MERKTRRSGVVSARACLSPDRLPAVAVGGGGPGGSGTSRVGAGVGVGVGFGGRARLDVEPINGSFRG